MAEKKNMRYFRALDTPGLVRVLFDLKYDRNYYTGKLAKAGWNNQNLMNKGMPVWRHVRSNKRNIAQVMTILKERGIKVEDESKEELLARITVIKNG